MDPRRVAVFSMLLGFLSGGAAFAELGTGFTYQGRLESGGTPAQGAFDLNFVLYDAETAGAQVGPTVERGDVPVSQGLFNLTLDFGAVFTGSELYLEIGVRPGSSAGAYTTLEPRQRIGVTPYALALPGLYTQPNDTSPNLVGGFAGNEVTAGAVGAVIGGGGAADDGAGHSARNQVTDDYGTVGGGWMNRAGDGAGSPKGAPYAAVGGGSKNVASALYSVVGGGFTNTAGGAWATVGGGQINTVAAMYATVCGGSSNLASGSYSIVAGGGGNVASGFDAFVGGGIANVASGVDSAIPGGDQNHAAGDYSFAAGRRARISADHDGAFLFADGNNFNFASWAANEFGVRATGGVRFVSAINAMGLPESGVYLAPGANAWQPLPLPSDRNLKTGFEALDQGALLKRLAGLSIRNWSFIGSGPQARHIGPTAQDFHAAFGVGDDERTISPLDASGVALAAIQELHRQLQERDERVAALEARLAALEEKLATQP